VRQGIEVSIPEALSALVFKYIESVVAVEAAELENFFANFVSRAKVRDAVKALLAARELSLAHVGSRSMLQIASKVSTPPPDPARKRPIVQRPRVGVRK
jgi:hypothetical protein